MNLEDLHKMNDVIIKFKQEYPEVSGKLIKLLKKFNRFGYKNFCRLFIGSHSPEQLKLGKDYFVNQKDESDDILKEIFSSGHKNTR